MSDLPYNHKDKHSIINYATKLVNQTLRDLPNIRNQLNNKNKGSFGNLLEKYYFLYPPNPEHEPDFKEAGLELKSSPIKQLRGQKYNSKERLVLNIINYTEVVHQKFFNSSFWKKNKNLLLVFYIHRANESPLDFKIAIVGEWEFKDIDLEIIKRDWNTINQKIIEGKAHELSEGDTLYLGACTKGGKGGNPRKQPNSTIKAKQRAYSLKQSYVNHIIATLSNTNEPNYGKLIPSLSIAKSESLEDIVTKKFKKYYGYSLQEIQTKLGISLNQNAKNFYASLTKAILGIELKQKIEEFQKAGIIVKTVRLNKEDLPKEHISFSAFSFIELIAQEWETSTLKKTLEQKFLFIFLKYDKNGYLKLEKTKFWNMPYSDIEDVKEVWDVTKKIIKNGDIVKNIKINKNEKE